MSNDPVTEQDRPKKKKYNPYLDGGTKEDRNSTPVVKYNDKSSFIQQNNPNNKIDSESNKNDGSALDKKPDFNNKLSALKMARSQVEAIETVNSLQKKQVFNLEDETSFELPR
jgi:hypothetical protein